MEAEKVVRKETKRGEGNKMLRRRRPLNKGVRQKRREGKGDEEMIKEPMKISARGKEREKKRGEKKGG